MPLARVIAERPDVFNHNLEVVPRLYPLARRGSRWERSLRVLRNAKALGEGEVVTKSGLMVGLGETHEEMVGAFEDLREAGVQVLTVGQYLRPTGRSPAGRPLLAPGRVQGAREGGLRARLRPHRRRAARALELPRRPARPAGAARRRPARRGRRRLMRTVAGHHLAQVNIAIPLRAAGERAAGAVRRASRAGQRPRRRRAGLRLAPAGRGRRRDRVPRLRRQRLIVNLSVWESVEALRAFVYTDPEHLAVLRRRSEWFELDGGLPRAVVDPRPANIPTCRTPRSACACSSGRPDARARSRSAPVRSAGAGAAAR